MGRLSLFAFALFIFIATSLRVFGAEPNEDRFQIDIITVDPGAELFARWGHISIVVTDKLQQTRKAYNFGTFNFDDPGLRFRYLKGFLDYWLSSTQYERLVERYKSQNLGIVSRTLKLTPEQAVSVAELLEVNALPENRTYAYRHYHDNCCTRIRDLLNGVLGGSITEEFDTVPTGRTYRFYTARAMKGMPVTRNIILFLLGRDTDRPITRWDEQFLPEVFGGDLDKINIAQDNSPLVAQKRVLHKQAESRSGEKTVGWEVWVAASTISFLIFGFGIPLLFHKKGWKWIRQAAGIGLFLWGFIGGFGGLLLILLWAGTTHYDSHNNENVLVFPFTHLWLLGPGLVLIFKGRLSRKIRLLLQRYLIGCLALLGTSLLLKLGPFFQANYPFIAFAFVLNTASLFLLRFLAKEAAVEKSDSFKSPTDSVSFLD